MFIQPLRIGGIHFRLKLKLASGGFVANAEQRVPRAGSTLLGRLDPVALTLERIARNRDTASGLPLELAVEGDSDSGLVQPRYRIKEPAAVHRVGRSRRGPLHARHHHRLDAASLVRPRQNRHGAEYRPRADFEHHVHTHIGQGLDALAILHRLAGQPTPIRSVHRLVGIQHLAGHAAYQRDRRRRHRGTGDQRLHPVQNGLHHGAVVPGALLQSPNPHLVGLEAPQHRLDVVDRSAHHHMSPVVGGNGHPRVARRRALLLHRGCHVSFRGEHRGHRTGLGQLSGELSPADGEPKAILQAEHPRGVGRRYLTQAVPDHQVGPHPQSRPQCGQRTLHGVDGGLRPRWIVQIAIGIGQAEHHVQKRGPALLSEDLLAAIQDHSHHRLALVERFPHPNPLAAQSGKGKGHLQVGTRSRCLVFGAHQRIELLSQRLGVFERHPGPMGVMAATHSGGPNHVGEQLVGRGIKIVIKPRQITLGQIPQGLV